MRTRSDILADCFGLWPLEDAAEYVLCAFAFVDLNPELPEHMTKVLEEELVKFYALMTG